jgi:hypothetical protein
MKRAAIFSTIILLTVWSAASAALAVNSSGRARGPVRLDDADPNAIRSLIEHDIGNIRTTLSNWGVWGNPDGAPGFHGWEWPYGSGNHFLFSAGLWVGAQIDTVHRVSTTTDGDNGTGEFWPVHIGTNPPDNSADDWWLLSYGLEEYQGRHYIRTDTARAYQEYYAEFQDSISLQYVHSPDADGHRPLDIEVSQRSYTWPGYLMRDAVMVDYRITNMGTQPLHHVFLALFADPDIGAAGETGDNASAHDGNMYDATRLMAVQGKYDFWNGAPTPGLFAMKITGTPVPLDQLRVTFRNFARMVGGDPPTDADKYALMSSGTSSNTSSYVDDWRMVLCFGPLATDGFELAPGGTLPISVAFLSGPNVDSLDAYAERAQTIFDTGYDYHPPAPALNFRQLSTASGMVQLAWSPPHFGTVSGYNLYGRDSGGSGQQVQFNTGLITDTLMLLNGLQNGMDWLFLLETVAPGGETSLPAELLCRIGAPSVPTGLQGHMEDGTVWLSWNNNPEPNITGYRVIRTTALGADTFSAEGNAYEDNTGPRGYTNVYAVNALNDLDIYSFNSSTVSYIPFAPQHRILVVDETTVHIGWPTLDSVRVFYQQVLNNAGVDFDYCQTAACVTVDSLAKYDLVIWHSECLSSYSQSQEDVLHQYSRAGGRILRIGIRLLSVLLSNFNSGINPDYPADLAPLSFDSLYVSSWSVSHPGMQFVGANTALPGFPAFTLDSAKVCSLRWSGSVHYCYLPYVDLFWPKWQTHALYRSVVGPADSSGFADQPCGVIGDRQILLSFPLYFLHAGDAQSLLTACIDTLRTMYLGVEPEKHSASLPATTLLLPNYPNPFNPSTTLRFDLAQAKRVRLAIYNVLGQEVALLVDDLLPAGSHQLLWNATECSSGIYFAVLKSGDFRQTQKMVLLK